CKILAKEPGLCGTVNTTEVRSLPVLGVGLPGFPTSTKRVVAPLTSATELANTSKPKISAARSGAAAASTSPRDTASAAAPVEEDGWNVTSGIFSANQPRIC